MVVPKLVPSVELVNSIVIEVGNKWNKKSYLIFSWQFPDPGMRVL